MHRNEENSALAKNTLDQIPTPAANARRITGLVKEGGSVTGYRLSDKTVLSKEQAIQLARQGQIAGVGIAHRKNTEYLKSIPDGKEGNNLGNLPSVSPSEQS